MSSLDIYRRNVYSQNGEDGVITEILRRLGIECGTCVDVGANDGKSLSNTYHLIEQGWAAVLIERDSNLSGSLLEIATMYPQQVQVISRIVGFEVDDNLDVILAKTDIPHDFDLLNIDIDGYDLQVWAALTAYYPKIVIVEINSSIPLGVHQIHGNGAQGASVTSMLDLATAKGYRFVCHTGNMIFVLSSLADRLSLPDEEIRNPSVLFNYNGPSQ